MQQQPTSDLLNPSGQEPLTVFFRVSGSGTQACMYVPSMATYPSPQLTLVQVPSSGEQFVQVPLVTLMVPHDMHLSAPPLLAYVPSGQAVHDALPVPKAYVPAGQAVQEVAPAPE